MNTVTSLVPVITRNVTSTNERCCSGSGVQPTALYKEAATLSSTITSLVDYHQLGRLVRESTCERKDPGSNPAADMVDAARNTAWDLGKIPNNYRSNYPTQ
ncbi:hypothetical protein FHG87_009302 [Trinorchestia longiramus]|nr:hypothetical protein FHG87_009302 [Trinorchestia longiramus]